MPPKREGGRPTSPRGQTDQLPDALGQVRQTETDDDRDKSDKVLGVAHGLSWLGLTGLAQVEA